MQTRQRLADETVTILAGFAAERKYTGRANCAGAKADFDGAKIYARLAAGGEPEGMAAYLKWCGFLAREAASSPHNLVGMLTWSLHSGFSATARWQRTAGPARNRWRGER
jgi:hypothetical protein